MNLRPLILGKEEIKRLSDHLAFTTYYRCNIQFLDVEKRKERLTKQKNSNRRKREYIRDYCGYCMVTDESGWKIICFIKVYKEKSYGVYDEIEWGESEPLFSSSDIDEVSDYVKDKCRKYYIEKYGEFEDYYSVDPKKKKYSIGEIIEWFRAFQDRGLSMSEIDRIRAENKQLKNDIATYESLMIKAAIRKGKLKI